ncbi:type IV pilin N-terminal domain-containing protein [Methanofollis ethanolicus]|uniref:type IV pilin N-terminal domain-containing protein n=1 Tax=Methanofollis ethanolicus TaxID=488124 RepID=UPI0009F8A112|nr:type IV pilin N-terminal domain-containing protein [Methanofollis ethanolicus]
MKGLNSRDGGISEVFGVMLILTITLIVACVVTVFAGGFSPDTKTDAISANIVASDLYMDRDNSCAYILFDHISGDPVDLNAVVITLGRRDSAKMTTRITNADQPTGFDETGSRLTHYLKNYGEDKSTITAGDRFVLYADDCDDEGIYWQNEDADERFSVRMNDYITYRIVDTRSNRPISSGKIPVSSTG